MRLSAAMIVRDERSMLGDCLASLEGLVDEVVVVDTGSTDGTPELAGGLGARVFSRPWDGDFSAARNEALRRSRGEFVLYIDADERVTAGTRSDVERLLADPGVVACTVLFRPRSGFTRYREYRLFRNDPRIRFRGVIHETMLPDIVAAMERDGLRIAPSPIAIDHLGYDGDQRRKHLRNVPLLRARLAQDPEHVYCWTHLGHALAGLGDREAARAAWWRAVEAARRNPAPDDHDVLPYLALIEDQIAGGSVPEELLEEACARFPDNHGLAWLRARALAARGHHADAVALFERLAALDPETMVDERLAYDVRLFGTWSVAALALSLFRLGRYAESAGQYALAEALDPGDAGHAVRRRLAETRARREAVATLDASDGCPYDDDAAERSGP